MTKTGVIHMSGTFAPYAIQELQKIYSGQSESGVKAADYGNTWWFVVGTW